MNSKANWSDLFSRSSFFAINKEEELNLDLLKIQDNISYHAGVDSFHPKRKEEFLLGRVCASVAHRDRTGVELLSLPVNQDRSPLWPSEVVGSISHNQFWVGAAVAKSTELLGVGIDFEVVGRTKLELAAQIRSDKDIKTHPELSPEELLTLIFSCKESLYKALYPTVKKFFGFEDAALREIDLTRGEFAIELLNDLNLNFGPNSRQTFHGRFTVLNKSCLTVLEIAHS